MKWNLEKRKLSDLKEYHKNPRSLSKCQFEHIKLSIDKFGLIDKPIVTKDNTIIGGHQRLKVLKRCKVKEVECWVATEDLTAKISKNLTYV